MDPLGGSLPTHSAHAHSNPAKPPPNPFLPHSPSPTARVHQQPHFQPHPSYPKPPSPASSWPSSPLIKPHTATSQTSDQSIVWPSRMATGNPPNYKPSTPTREPRSPIREEHRRPTPNRAPSASPPTTAYPNPAPAQATFANRPKPERQTRIRVTGIERNRRDLYVKFDAWSNLTTNRTGHCPNVSRSYREFSAFHESIVSNNPHTIVPPVPFPNTSAPNPADDDRLVASAFQQFFDRLLMDPSLRTDDELRLFLESDFGYTPQTKPKRKGAGGGSGWLSKPAVGGAARTLPSASAAPGGGAHAPDTVVSVLEEDELANAKLQFRLLEDRLADACRTVESVSRARRTLGQALLELSGRLGQFATTEAHGALAEGFRRLGQTVRAVSELETHGAVGYLVTLSDGLGWCALSAKAAKDVLRNRAGVLQEHYASVKKSLDKRRLIERIKSSTLSVSAERVESALDELEEAKKAEETIAQKALLISTNLRPALRTHSRLLHDDLLYSLMENARTQLIYEKQVLKELERLKPELDGISLKPANVVYRQPASEDRRGSGIGQVYPNDQPTRQLPDRIVGTANAGSEWGSHHKTQPARIGEMAKSVVVSTARGENVDARQRVDAKSAAASLARLF